MPFVCRLIPQARVCSLLLAVFLGLLPLGAREFSVAVYNVENLFDVDGIAAYDDYQSAVYTPAHLRTKILNTSEAVARLVPSGQGPDIVFFQEIEVDQTPTGATRDLHALIAPDASRTAAQILSEPLDAAHTTWPAEAWLLKAIEDRGLKGYTVIVGSDGETRHEDGNMRSIKNVIFTRFPVKEVRQLPIENARNILEVLVLVDGRPLRLFSNHWKSGASDEKTERLRVQNAHVLRARLDELLAADPHADIILGGDFNSQYNQKARYPKMPETGLNDVLRSQGNELALTTGGADLYNLWYELPNSDRGSDTFRGEWGTLMQLMVTPGLYDNAGIQYVDNSFHVGRIQGLNTNADGTPRRWNGKVAPAGTGFSDHYPIVANFVTIEKDAAGWMKLSHSSDGQTPTAPVRIVAPLTELMASARDANAPGINLRDGSSTGSIFLVKGRVSGTQPLVVELANGETYEIYSPDRTLRDSLRTSMGSGSPVRFYGELGQFKGRWQFVIKDAAWLLPVQ